MRGVARVTDRTLGTCSHPSHPAPITVGGTIETGSTITKDQGLPIARIDDRVKTDCGHIDYINTASGTITGEFKKVARLSDTVGRDGIYNASIISASTVTFGDP